MELTRHALHALGEHVLAAARYQAEGRIGLAVVPGGIATPPFGPDRTVVGVVGRELLVQAAGSERRQPVTTLREAGEFVGVTPGAPRQVYSPTTSCDLDAPLTLDPSEFEGITSWYELVDDALALFRAEIAGDDPSATTLWPEHFDDAIRAADVNYGGLAGDDTVPVPYVYVGPPPSVLTEDPSGIWNQSFGATATWDEIREVNQALEFFRRGRAAARRATGEGRA